MTTSGNWDTLNITLNINIMQTIDISFVIWAASEFSRRIRVHVNVKKIDLCHTTRTDTSGSPVGSDFTPPPKTALFETTFVSE